MVEICLAETMDDHYIPSFYFIYIENLETAQLTHRKYDIVLSYPAICARSL